jgi:hypothetical protein
MERSSVVQAETGRRMVRVGRWNWGLILALLLCLAFWASLALGVFASL